MLIEKKRKNIKIKISNKTDQSDVSFKLCRICILTHFYEEKCIDAYIPVVNLLMSYFVFCRLKIQIMYVMKTYFFLWVSGFLYFHLHNFL